MNCAICQCDDRHACLDVETGEPCHWASPGLCSVCARTVQAELLGLTEMPPANVELPALELCCLVSAAQLAMRHPHFPASIAQSVYAVATRLQAQLPPTLQRFAAMGWDRTNDVPVGNASTQRGN